MLLKVLILGLLVHVSASFLSLKTHAITRCVSESCESGVGLYPHCADCNKFIYCVFGHPIQKECPLGLRFDIVRGVCNFPHDSTCWNTNSGSSIVSQNTALRDGPNRVDQTIPNASPIQTQDRQISNLPDVDVSQPPVSMMTDDPPVGFDEDGHETQAPSNDLPKGSEPKLPNDVNKNRLLPNIDVSQPPVSMMTDDPPVGFDEDGHETQPLRKDSPKDLLTDKNKLIPDDVSQPPVSMMTDDPPVGFDENGHETQAPVEPQKKQQSASGFEQKPDVNEKKPFSLEDVSKPPMVSENEEEEQNGDFTVNPDFDQGAQNSLLNSQSVDWKNMFAKMNMPGFGGINLQNAPSGQPAQVSNGQTSEDEKIALSPAKDSAASAKEQSSAESTNDQNSAQSKVVSSGQNNAPKAQVPCVTNCNGLASGNYQSCNGCESYMVCMMGLQFLTPCPDSTRWDDITKRCSDTSSTCY